eukprot:1537163-Pleurochrysis_carterae.AAC.1
MCAQGARSPAPTAATAVVSGGRAGVGAYAARAGGTARARRRVRANWHALWRVCRLVPWRERRRVRWRAQGARSPARSMTALAAESDGRAGVRACAERACEIVLVRQARSLARPPAHALTRMLARMLSPGRA